VPRSSRVVWWRRVPPRTRPQRREPLHAARLPGRKRAARPTIVLVSAELVELIPQCVECDALSGFPGIRSDGAATWPSIGSSFSIARTAPCGSSTKGPTSPYSVLPEPPMLVGQTFSRSARLSFEGNREGGCRRVPAVIRGRARDSCLADPKTASGWRVAGHGYGTVQVVRCGDLIGDAHLLRSLRDPHGFRSCSGKRWPSEVERGTGHAERSAVRVPNRTSTAARKREHRREVAASRRARVGARPSGDGECDIGRAATPEPVPHVTAGGVQRGRDPSVTPGSRLSQEPSSRCS
jgi:hypothetical protein